MFPYLLFGSALMPERQQPNHAWVAVKVLQPPKSTLFSRP